MTNQGGETLEPTQVEPPGEAVWAPKTLLVLGGGGMKGMAHVGVVKALEEAAIQPDAVIGTSIGALIGTLIAGGLGWRELFEIARKLKKEDIVSVNRRALWFGGLRSSSVFEPDNFRAWMDRTLPAHHFAELILPLRFNATSLVTGKEIWFGTDHRQDVGLVDAIYASCALPVYFPPARIAGDYLTDGGILNVLPLDEAARWNPKRVIAVDVGADLMPPNQQYFDQGLLAVHDRVLNLTLLNQRDACLDRHRELPMLYIRPKIGQLQTFDFDRNQFFMEEGYRAASEALNKAAAA